MSTIPAGSPSVVDSEGEELDLNSLIVKNPDSTYAVTVTEDAPDFGISRGDLLIVDRELEPKVQSVVLIERDAFFSIKLYSQIGSALRLVGDERQPAKEREPVWGVVTYSLRKFA